MKKFLKTLLIFLSISFSLIFFTEKTSAQSVSFQAFYDNLSPYGSWYQSPEYGYVWRPQLSGFTPYSTNGYWVLTDAGWTWVSDYSWGWAPFHYGRWYNDPSYGYVWVPGYEWGPGWVSWRQSNDYYGWAPIGPGVNINVAYGNEYNLPYNQWNFVRCNDFGRRNINNYYVDRSRNVTIINNTTVINTTRVDNTRNTTYSTGPDRAEVQKRIGRQIKPVTIVDEKQPAQRITGNKVQLYRPMVENSKPEQKPVPAKVLTFNEPARPSATKEKPVTEPGREPAPDQKEVIKNPVITENKQPVKPELQQPVKRTIGDEPVNQSPVQQPSKINNDDRDNRTEPQMNQPIQKNPEQTTTPSTKQNTLQQQPPHIQQSIKKPPVRQPQIQQAQPVHTQAPVQHLQRPAPQSQPRMQPQPSRQQQPAMQRPAVREGRKD